jgi:hypothetical protein
MYVYKMWHETVHRKDNFITTGNANTDSLEVRFSTLINWELPSAEY